MAAAQEATAAAQRAYEEAAAPGRAVQVHPIEPSLKPPGTKRLKLEHDEVLSSFALKSNLRRYSPARRPSWSSARSRRWPRWAVLLNPRP